MPGELSRQLQILGTHGDGISIGAGRPCWVNLESCGPARYLWTSALSGNRLPLCEECCAAWRFTALDEPDLAASRITLLADDIR